MTPIGLLSIKILLTHRTHELVIWIPLVNCYKTMCMHMFDRKFREKAVSLFSSKKKDRFEKFAKNIWFPC